MTPSEKREKITDMHFVQGMGQTAIAKALGIPVGTVSHLISVEKVAREKASEYQATGDKQTETPEGSLEEQQQVIAAEKGKEDRLRKQALRVLKRAMHAKEPLPEHQIDAANKILGRLAKPRQEQQSLSDWQSQYEAMPDHELAERIVTCACTILGPQVVRQTLDRLEAMSQALV